MKATLLATSLFALTSFFAASWNLASASSSHTFFITLAVLLLGFSATGMMDVVYRRKKAHR